MRQRTGPHDVGTGLVILGVLQGALGHDHNGTQQSLGNAVGQHHVSAVGEVALQGVGHDVHTAAGGLVGGQGVGQLGVQDGELGAGNVVVDGALLAGLLLGDNAGVGHLAAGCGQSDHAGNGGAGSGDDLLADDVPHIAVIAQAVADGLAGVDDAAAANAQQEVNVLLLAQLDALIDLGQAGVGHNAAQLHVADTGLVQRLQHLVQQTAAHHAAAAVVDQHLGGAVGLAQLAGAGLGVLTKDDFCGGVVLKINHFDLLLH